MNIRHFTYFGMVLFCLSSFPMVAAEQAGSGQKGAAEAIYGKQLMSPEERAEFQEKMRSLKTPEERQAFREEHRKKMMERAKEQGVTLPPCCDPGEMGGGMGPGGMGPHGGMGSGRGPGNP